MNRARIGRWSRTLTLLVATSVTIVVTLAVLYIVVTQVGKSRELTRQRSENRTVAHALGSALADGLTGGTSQSFQQLLLEESMRATIDRSGRTVTLGAPAASVSNAARVRVVVPGGGSVSVDSAVDGVPDPPLLIVLLATGALVVVLGVAVGTNVLLTRETRRRVALAVSAADRISAGDFSARIGSDGPEPLHSLGNAFDGMVERLAEVDEAQRELLADLAHEIATPIHAVTGFANAVLDGTVSPEDARSAIRSQTQRLSELLDELTELRVLDDQQAPHITSVDLRQLLQDVISDLGPMPEHVDVQSRLDPVSVHTDPDLVRTVVSNLLTNALRFTPAGGSVTTSLMRRRDIAVISIRDTGPGIPAEQQSRVFDRFYRVEPARERSTGGTGLGLSIARKAAERVGGRLELTSEVGVGSEFRLALPLAAAHPKPMREARADPLTR